MSIVTCIAEGAARVYAKKWCVNGNRWDGTNPTMFASKSVITSEQEGQADVFFCSLHKATLTPHAVA